MKIASRKSSFIKRIRTVFSSSKKEGYRPEDLFEVERFYRDWRGFRSEQACARQTGFSVEQCSEMKQILRDYNLLGNYAFTPGAPPHSFMREEIHRRIPALNARSTIVEVGPGDHPLFPPEEYCNWVMCDPGYTGDSIEFREHTWGVGRYPQDRAYRGSWEHLADVLPDRVATCDLVVGCHSFEHCFRPVTAIRQVATLLKPGGWLVLFVPDGFSDDPSNNDPTHTFYVVPGMLEDFFQAAGGFSSLVIEPFRPNADLIVLAQRETGDRL